MLRITSHRHFINMKHFTHPLCVKMGCVANGWVRRMKGTARRGNDSLTRGVTVVIYMLYYIYIFNIIYMIGLLFLFPSGNFGIISFTLAREHTVCNWFFQGPVE